MQFQNPKRNRFLAVPVLNLDCGKQFFLVPVPEPKKWEPVLAVPVPEVGTSSLQCLFHNPFTNPVPQPKLGLGDLELVHGFILFVKHFFFKHVFNTKECFFQ